MCRAKVFWQSVCTLAPMSRRCGNTLRFARIKYFSQFPLLSLNHFSLPLLLWGRYTDHFLCRRPVGTVCAGGLLFASVYMYMYVFVCIRAYSGRGTAVMKSAARRAPTLMYRALAYRRGRFPLCINPRGSPPSWRCPAFVCKRAPGSRLLFQVPLRSRSLFL